MVLPVRPDHLAKGAANERDAEKEAHGQPRVHEAVVNDHVGDPERRHAGAHAEDDLHAEARPDPRTRRG